MKGTGENYMKLKYRICIVTFSAAVIICIWMAYLQLMQDMGVINALLTLLGIIGLIGLGVIMALFIAITFLLIIVNLLAGGR